jgi:hypothetical protein
MSKIYLSIGECKSCAYCNEASGLQPDGIGWQTIECEIWDGNFDITPVYDDGFGCNKWEAKNRIEDTVVEKGYTA